MGKTAGNEGAPRRAQRPTRRATPRSSAPARGRGVVAPSERPAQRPVEKAAKASDEKSVEKPGRGRVAAIEGMRALAILAVVLYHAKSSWLPGGYFGVSVFFVFTGYLTTLSVERDLDRSGRIDYPCFIMRRLGRLLPSVVALVGVTTLLCALFSPSLLPKLKSDALSALLLFENVHYILSDVPYFAAAGLPSPTTHLWFLGVTMQFYLVWPLLLALLRRACPNRRVLVGVVAGLAVASAVEMALLFDPRGDTSRIYYGLDTRAAELLAGAACALVTRGERWSVALPSRDGKRRRLPFWAYDLAGAAAVAALVAMALTLDGYSELTYRGGFLIAALLSAVVVAVVIRGPKGLLARALGARPLVAVGGLSFSLYLWHYPLLLVMNPATRTVEVPWWGWVLEFAVISVVSALFSRYVEKGAGRPLAPGLTRPRLAAYGLCALSLIVLAAVPLDGIQAGTPTSQQSESSQGAPASPTDDEGGAGDASDGSGASEGDDAQDSDEDGQADEKGGGAQAGAPAPSDYEVDPETGVTDAKVLLVGDSVSLGCEAQFYEIFPNGWMDSQISRQLYAGVDVYESCVAAGHDASVVIFALGSNGPATEDDVRALIEACGPDKRVLLVNTRVPDAIQDRNNALLSQVAAEYPNVEVVDWYSTSTGHSEYFWDDGTHLRPEGADAYVAMLRQAVTGR